ncbi:MAG: FAD-dependent thymidylate synthase [Deltaproteobacteria bacterium]|nr:FAD-dependent thymidylate synthase [Deltaproteobacteria bacterium]
MLRVILAGHTLDREFVQSMRRGELPADVEPTPETISAAYARISRFPEPIPELRAQARRDVPASRKSNRTIVFRMGHHSVAEHVQLNFDILGVSRLALEALEDARLCSYTEKSQRYVTFGGEHVVPEEFGPAERELFEAAAAEQIAFYRRAFEKLLELQRKRNSDMLGTKTGVETVEGWAKEDARYALGLATETQLGFSGNARNLEHVVRKLRHHPLAEVRALSRGLFDAASEVAPSLIILSDPERFREAFGRDVSDGFVARGRATIERLARETMASAAPEAASVGWTEGDVTLLGGAADPDAAVIAALLHSGSGLPYANCSARAKAMSSGERRGFVCDALAELSEFDALPREFEAAAFTFEIALSAACFGQLKRHRMMTLVAQPYDPALGITIPEAVREAGLAGELRELAERSAGTFARLASTQPRAAEYVLTNAHRRRALAVINLREIHHMARLRMDKHAQWDIRDVTASITALARRAAPATALLACGKDAFASVRSALRA